VQEFAKVATLENEIEALRLESELDGRGIPYAVRSYHDTAYDGLFQLAAGWGHLEAPAQYREEILVILADIRRADDQLNGTGGQPGQDQD